MLVCGRHNKWLANTLQQPYSEWIPTSVLKRQCTMDQSSFLFNSFQDTTGLAMDILSQFSGQIKNPECFQLQTPALPTVPELKHEVSRGSFSSSEIISVSSSASTASCSPLLSQGHCTDYENKTDSRRDALLDAAFYDEERANELRAQNNSDDGFEFNNDLEKKQQDNYRACQILEYQTMFHSDSKALGGWIHYTFDSDRGTLKHRMTHKDVLLHAFAANVVQYNDGLADVTFHNLLTQQNIAFCDEVAVMHNLMLNRNLHRMVNKPFLSAKKYPGNDFICTVTMKVQPKTTKTEISYNVPVYFWPKISKSQTRILDWNVCLHYPPA
jgi:hypothetical protein